MGKKIVQSAVLSIVLLASAAAASPVQMSDIVCSVITQVLDTLNAIGPALVLLMFLYGGVKYVYSADDPGGRKQGKDICVHAVIGGIIILLAGSILTIIGLTGGC
jgi:hypothetical protein